jgi:DNA-binding protein Fis
MKQTGGNQSHASRLLGIARPTLHANLQRYVLGRES